MNEDRVRRREREGGSKSLTKKIMVLLLAHKFAGPSKTSVGGRWVR